jgi:predicted transcriptional regulator
MTAILLSIKPEFVEEILRGEKRFEFRRRKAKKKVVKLFIYCTSPRKMVVGEAEIKAVLSYPPEELWEKTKDDAGLSKERFLRYFAGRKLAYAYSLGRVVSYQKAKLLSDFGCKSAPQSFFYVP